MDFLYLSTFTDIVCLYTNFVTWIFYICETSLNLSVSDMVFLTKWHLSTLTKVVRVCDVELSFLCLLVSIVKKSDHKINWLNPDSTFSKFVEIFTKTDLSCNTCFPRMFYTCYVVVADRFSIACASPHHSLRNVCRICPSFRGWCNFFFFTFFCQLGRNEVRAVGRCQEQDDHEEGTKRSGYMRWSDR